jgi:hypothetical protein
MKKHHAVTMQMGTNTHIFDCGRGYGETKSPSSCKSEKIPQGFLSDIAKLALKMIDLLYKPIYRKNGNKKFI